MVWLGPFKERSIEELETLHNQTKNILFGNHSNNGYQWQLNKQGHLVYSNDENDRLVDPSLLKDHYNSKAFRDAAKQYEKSAEKSNNPYIEHEVMEDSPGPKTENWDTKQKWWVRFLKWLMR